MEAYIPELSKHKRGYQSDNENGVISQTFWWLDETHTPVAALTSAKDAANSGQQNIHQRADVSQLWRKRGKVVKTNQNLVEYVPG